MPRLCQVVKEIPLTAVFSVTTLLKPLRVTLKRGMQVLCVEDVLMCSPYYWKLLWFEYQLKLLTLLAEGGQYSCMHNPELEYSAHTLRILNISRTSLFFFFVYHLCIYPLLSVKPSIITRIVSHKQQPTWTCSACMGGWSTTVYRGLASSKHKWGNTINCLIWELSVHANYD